MSRDYRVGIDLGSNTLGWAALELRNPERWEPCGLLAGGVIVFPDGRDQQKFEPLNVGRRVSRGQRKRLRARRWRRDRLVEALRDAGLIAEAPDRLDAVHFDHTRPGSKKDKHPARDPWVLRLEALERPLTKLELAKVLLHLARHHGFRSGALGRADDKDNSPKTWRQRENELKMRIAADNRAWNPDQVLTAGGWYGLQRRSAPAHQPLPAARNRDNAGLVLPPTRPLIAQEFDEIQRAQRPHHNLSDEQWKEIRALVIEQRPLRLQADRIGLCEFEDGQPRAYTALTTSAIFRIRQDLCNLRVEGFDKDGILVEPRRLTCDERNKLEAGFAPEAGQEVG